MGVKKVSNSKSDLQGRLHVLHSEMYSVNLLADCQEILRVYVYKRKQLLIDPKNITTF